MGGSLAQHKKGIRDMLIVKPVISVVISRQKSLDNTIIYIRKSAKIDAKHQSSYGKARQRSTTKEYNLLHGNPSAMPCSDHFWE